MVVRDLITKAQLYSDETTPKSQDRVGGLSFSADGRLLAYRSGEDVCVRTVTGWQQLGRLHVHFCVDLQFAPHGRDLAILAPRESLIWQLNGTAIQDTNAVCRFSHGHDEPLGPRAVVWSPDGSTLFVSDRAERIFVYGVQARRLQSCLDDFIGADKLAVSPDGHFLAAGNWEGRIAVWSLTNLMQVALQRVAPSSVNGLCFSPDNQTLVTGGDDQLVKLWALSMNASHSSALSLTLTREFRGHEAGITSIGYLAGKLISAGWDGTIRTWSTNSPQGWLSEFRPPEGERLLGHFMLGESEDNDRAWYLSSDHGLVGWDLHRAGDPATIAPLPTDVQNLTNRTELTVFSCRSLWHEGKLLYPSADGWICRFVPESGIRSRLFRLPSTDFFIQAVLTNRTIPYLLVAKRDPDSELFRLTGLDLRSGAPATGPWANYINQIAFSGTPPQTIAQSPDGARIVVADRDGMISFWDALLDKAAVQVKPDEPGCRVAFSPDSRSLAVGYYSPKVSVYEASSGRSLTESFRVGLSAVEELRFSTDARTLLTSSDDGSTRMHSLVTRQEMIVLPDTFLISGSCGDKGLLLWLGSMEQGGWAGYLSLPSLAVIDAELAASPAPR